MFNRNNKKVPVEEKKSLISTPNEIAAISGNAFTGQDVLASITSNFEALCYVNTVSGKIGFLTLSDKLQTYMSNVISPDTPVEDYARIYARGKVHPDYQEEFIKETSFPFLQEIMKEKSSHHFEYLVMHDDKSVSHYVMKVFKVIGSEEHLVLGFADIEEEVQRQAERQKELELSNNVKDEFLKNMSHEILTPLNAIKGNIEMAKVSLSSPDDVLTYLKDIDDAATHLHRLVRNVLFMSDSSRGKNILTMENANIIEIIERTTNLFRPEIERQGKHMILDTSKLIVPNLVLDISHFNRIFAHLLGNAVKFTEKGGTIILTGTQEVLDEKRVMCNFVVKDDGIGMAPEYTNALFDLFSTERPQTETQNNGVGLGMTITKRILDIIGGTISVVSKKNFGTEFTIRVPLDIAK